MIIFANPRLKSRVNKRLKSMETVYLYWLLVMFGFDPVRMCSFKYRDRVTIFRDVLKTIRRYDEGGRKYAIMKHASLSYDQLNKYLLFLTNMGYIKETAEPYGKKYRVTEKGYMFLRSLEDLRLHLHQK